MPLFSIIIPTYNRSGLLAEAIDSAWAQEWTDYELIVVDDGSTDDTPAVLAGYAERHPAGLRVIRQANAGQGAARNRAIVEARGEYCVFLDSDDLLFPWSLATVAEAISRHGRPSVVLGREAKFSASEEFKAIARAPLQLVAWPDIFRYAVRNPLGPCGILVARTELLRAAGGFLAERIVAEDADLMLRLGAAPNLVKIEQPALYGYRNHGGNFTGDCDAWRRGAHYFIRRYHRGSVPVAPQRAAEFQRQAADVVAYLGLQLFHRGARRDSLRIYLSTLAWQLRAGNYRYLLEQPIRLTLSAMRQLRGKRVPPE